MARIEVACVGEAMLEFAPVGDDLFRQGFAGDTMNSCWTLAQLLGDRAAVRYVTNVGTDPYSDRLLGFLEASGVGTHGIVRDPTRCLGLYVISLEGAERSFTYWRDTSAARRLADHPAVLDAAFDGCGLIFVSGITLAVIEEHGRRNLFASLASARKRGALVAFDPNVRLRLWPDEAALRAAYREMLEVSDIALPSFEDEAKLWGDASPEATLDRLAAAGVREVAVKDGEKEVAFQVGERRGRLPTPPVEGIRDTTGAGDAFNAGYLAARLLGRPQIDCCALGQTVAAETLKVYGALPPREVISRLPVAPAPPT